jgi:type VI secretion system secreted protein Hcp
MTFFRHPSRLASVALLLLAGYSLKAQDSVFMQHPTIKGESTDKNHANWINLSSLSGCISNTGKAAAAACDINISKDVDQSTTFVYSSLLTGKGTGSGKVLIDVCRINGGTGTQLCYYKLELGNARFTSAQAGTGGSGTSESWSIAFDSIKWTYTSVNPSTGAPNTPVSQCWSFITNTAVCP